MRKAIKILIAFITLAVAQQAAAAGALDEDARLKAMREEAHALVLIQSILGWYVRTQGEESIFEQTYKGHEDLFTADNIKYVQKFIGDNPGLTPDEKISLEFFRFYLTSEFMDINIAPLYDEVNNAEASATVKIEWIDNDVPYRDLDGMLNNEADAEKRKKLQAAMASVWENTLNPIHARIEEMVKQLAVEAGYPNYVAFSEQYRMVDLAKLIALSQEYIKKSDGLYRDLLAEQVREVMGYPLDQFTRSDIGRFAQAPYFNPYFPAELVTASYRDYLEGIGLSLTTAAGTEIFIDEEQRPKKHPRAACFSISPPGDVRFTVKPSGGIPDFETFFHEGGHAQHFANATAPLWEMQELGNNAVTEGYAIFFEGVWGNLAWLRKYQELVRDYNRLVAGDKKVPELMDADIAKLLRNRALWMIYFVRRYAGAKLLYESILHEGDPALYKKYFPGDTSDMQEVYRRLFSDAYGFELTPADALRFRTDVDSSFYSADYSRAFFLSVQFEEGIERKFGEGWLDNPEAGKFLRENFWSRGNSLQAYEAARLLGYDGLNTGAFERRIELMLRQSEELIQ
ncbi:MAG: hypothetical protein ABIH66_06520 [bacterium]